jgi:hypothetical protein
MREITALHALTLTYRVKAKSFVLTSLQQKPTEHRHHRLRFQLLSLC